MASPQKTIRRWEPPEGFRYEEDFLSTGEESELVAHIQKLKLKEFEFHGYLGKRRVASFGWHYDFASAQLNQADMIPDFLQATRERAAALVGVPAATFPHVLVTEYRPGTPIGWHRDRPVFELVIGVSLLSACTFRFRRRSDDGWERYSVVLDPRSIYLLSGHVREAWEHSIPAVESLRYSITFRSLRDRSNC